ncbi:MAG TPA: hypothetical protein VFG68_16640, partial [Fimbriiglobus sp.]|nr:hypothetical protein [Fimbriiglobus sp.]
MSTERHSPPSTPTEFTVRDLIRWAEVQDFASNALDPNWDRRANGIVITTDSLFPPQDSRLPNGFRFPSAAMTDYQRAVYYAAISRYHGPDPGTSEGFRRFQAMALRDGRRLDSEWVRRWVGQLCIRLGVSPDEAEALTLDEAATPASADPSPPATSTRGGEGETPPAGTPPGW